jgi:hypothetical protein
MEAEQSNINSSRDSPFLSSPLSDPLITLQREFLLGDSMSSTLPLILVKLLLSKRRRSQAAVVCVVLGTSPGPCEC